MSAGAEQPSHGRRRAIRQEDEDRIAGEQHGRSRGDASELRCAEVADDGGVGEDVERFGGEREERRDRESEDLVVVLAPAPQQVHATSCTRNR